MKNRLAATTTLVLLAAFTAACERTSNTPPSPTTSAIDGSQLSAPPAPSLAGTPIEPVPATHAATVEPPTPSEDTARDTPANEPAKTLADQKENSEMPLAGQVNNHSSDAFQSGRNENAAPERSESAAAPAEAPTDTPKPQS